MDPQAVFNQAVGLHQAGRLEEAAALYDQLLAQFPDHADTLHLRGVVELQRSAFENALARFDQVLSVNADHASALANRSAALIALGRYEDAKDSAARALVLTPDSLASFNNLASALNKLGRHEESLAVSDQALARGREDAKLHIHRAESFIAGRRYDDVIAACDRATSFDPGLPEAHAHRAQALLKLNRASEATASFEKALSLSPNSAEGFSSHALVLVLNRRPGDAIAACERALALQPPFPEALMVRALAFENLKRYADAIADCDAALALQPDLAEAYALRGMCFKGMKQPERALADFDVALELDPHLDLIPGQRILLSLQVAEWDGLERNIGDAIAAVEAGKYPVQPLVFNGLPSSPQLQRLVAERGFLQTNPPESRPVHPARPFNSKLRIGYFSSDLHDHPVGQLLVGMLEAHDRSQFEVVAFSFGGLATNLTRKRIEKACDRFVDALVMPSSDMVAAARALNIHIAVDLNGYTADMRSEIFAEGVAPIQVNYLGFPGTMGTERMHYIVGDAIVTPPEHAPFYAERIVTMPHSYLVTNDIKRHVPARLSTRRELGLPESGFAFCCFNAAQKITPDAFDVWMRLLKQVEGSFLWLGDSGATSMRNLRRAATERGVAPERLIFAPRTPGLEYLVRYRVADLFLDTFYYNAHATASEALMMGLPIVSRLGETFAGRVSASLLTAVGLPELIARTTEDYERIALTLARDPVAHQDVREKLARHMATYPLFDTPRYTRNLEAAYRAMWRRHEAGLPPDHIAVIEA